MFGYLIGVSVILSEKIVYSFANIIDGSLSRSVFKHVRTIIVYNGLFSIIFLPILYIVLRPTLLPLVYVPVFLIIGLCEMLYQVPYYKSLRESDPSVVSALFNLGRPIVPLLAYFIVGERLQPIQYAGFFFIIIGSIVVSYIQASHFRASRIFFMMLFAAVIISVQSVSIKYGVDALSWQMVVFWQTVFSLPMYLSLFFVKEVRTDFRSILHTHTIKSHLAIFVQNILSFCGSILGTFSFVWLPVTIAKGLSAADPLIILGIYALFGKQIGKYFGESYIDSFSVKKVVGFILIGAGVVLLFV